MNVIIKRFIKNILPADPEIVNRLLVTAFIKSNQLDVYDSYISNYYIFSIEDNLLYTDLFDKFYKEILTCYEKLSIEDLIEFFEFVISPAEKEVNGAVYTPLYIREYIVSKTLKGYSNNELINIKIGDLSCGCGGFFITAAHYIHKRTGISINRILQNFYGIDIASYSIERTRIILNLLCLQNGEDTTLQPNLYQANSLEFNVFDIDEIAQNNGFDVIIGNPPYVSSSKIAEESKQLLSNWSVASTGKTDLYLPFFQIAIEALKPYGVLGYITVNNFYRSLNGRAFRAYMSEHSYDLQMIDFGSEQVFKGRSTYTCICLISRREGHITYCKKYSKDINSIIQDELIHIEYDALDDFSGWTLCNAKIANNLKKIESIGIPLGKLYDIKNGFATLKNDVYLFTPIRETKKYFMLQYNNSEYKIEKAICRKAVKPNILKEDCDIEKNMEYLIYPYKLDANNKVILIEEDIMRKDYPFALEYLRIHYNALKHRDKETRQYASWYAYGRTQALNIVGNKLLFPYLADKPYFVLTEDKSLLFYNGYAIVNDSIHKLKVLKRILQSSVFWYYIKHTSKPYGGEYFALAKNYVKNFGIPQFSEEEERNILSLDDKQLNLYLEKIYDVNLDN